MSISRYRRLTAAAVSLAATALALSGCALDMSALGGDSPSTSAPSTSPKGNSRTQSPSGDLPPAPEGLEDFYAQSIEWHSCSGGECADVQAPLDYAHPDSGDTVNLALKVYRAEGERYGTLFVNPGGPGGSGIEYADSAAYSYPSEVLEHYDILGWDPRGVGDSTAIYCLTDEELDEAIAQWDDYLTDEGVKESEKQAAEVAGKCEANSGELLPYVGTESTARDLDMLRQLVGDAQLTYVGASYGTFIGAMYAELFPQNVGRLVLDGAVDATLNRAEADYQQLMGFEVAARKYVEQCTGNSCPLTGSDDEKMRQIQDFLDSLDDRTLETSDSKRPLTKSLAVTGVILPLYISEYDYLSMALAQAMEQEDGSLLLYLADLYNSRNDDGTYADNSTEAFWAINCADYLPVSAEESQAMGQRLEEDSLAFGAAIGGTDICVSWPYHPDSNPGPFVGKGSAPIVVVGTEHDPATPYQWAVNLSEQLEGGRLLTWKGGEGHTAFTRGSDCIDETITRYLVDGDVPADGAVCE